MARQPCRAISKEGLDHAGTVCAQPLLGWDVMLANLSPSPRGPHLFPGFGSVGEHFFVCATAHVNRDSNTNMPFRPFFYLAPGPGYDVFMKVHVAYQTCLNFFARCRADLKVTSQRPVGLEAKKKLLFCAQSIFISLKILYLLAPRPGAQGGKKKYRTERRIGNRNLSCERNEWLLLNYCSGPDRTSRFFPPACCAPLTRELQNHKKTKSGVSMSPNRRKPPEGITKRLWFACRKSRKRTSLASLTTNWAPFRRL